MSTSLLKLPDLCKIVIDEKLCLSVNKDGTDKEFPKKYISTVYSKIIKSKVPKSICEIGLRTGASLALWEKAFPEAEILAVDNGDDLRLVFPPRNKGTSISIVNAYTSAFLELIQEKSFDLIIDDGPHTLSSQQFTWRHLSRKLAPGGFLVIEDIQGGRKNLDRILRSDIINLIKLHYLIIDNREYTSQGDALAVLIHNCKRMQCNFGRDLLRTTLTTIWVSLHLSALNYWIKLYRVRLTHKAKLLFAEILNRASVEDK